MFVRNNTKCPNCGSCNTFDVSCEETGDFPDWLVRYECISCSWGLSFTCATHDLYKVFAAVFVRHQSDIDPLWVRAAYHESICAGNNLLAQVTREKQFVQEFVRYVVRKNAVLGCLVDDQILQNVVSYFVSKPERKRRYRSAHFLRTVGL